MRWFCLGHFAATWLVCTSLLFRFQAVGDSSITFILFSVMLWPLLLWALPMKGYFRLKAATLDRLKARVNHGELKKAVVFIFGFCASLLAAAGIAASTWAVGALDNYFSRQDGAVSLVHTLAFFPLAIAVWILVPTCGLALLARRRKTHAPIEA